MPKPELWKSIPSEWFDFESVYDEAVATAPRNGILVEVGSFWGQSAVYLAEAAKLVDKGLKIYCIDLWGETPQNNPPMFDKTQMQRHVEPRIHAQHNDSVFETFAHYLEKTRLSPDPLRVMRMESLEAADLFSNSNLHFVFLDGDHEYDYVIRELNRWEPLVSDGGMIAGHDYTEEFHGVIEATSEYFLPSDIKIEGRTWMVRK